ncbi:NADH dehydrogenase [ubiquinone] 1 beta subcomplex subunit 11, mitochondrial [Nematolebias whitei]|uniref:NADH dehydrogenase [ubiquinone] 1 beta subcomplex subunit 11, mitochondrial n=1 Tax=Nematolebias whitei TaxID=451745 RepID=UPI001897DDE3|nr:NADH dehydrogenase [ubiquinone] 1 beta subcomplex subunit 11, mitochondrial [Nematolebias whitei]
MLSRLSRFGLALPRSLSVPPARFVSQNKPSGAAGSALHAPPQTSEHGEVSSFVKNPEYYGFSDDPVQDEWNMKVAFFMGLSMCVVVGGVFLHYIPDLRMEKWARTEAKRLIILREAQGLPLINENYYDPSKIILPAPSDE